LVGTNPTDSQLAQLTPEQRNLVQASTTHTVRGNQPGQLNQLRSTGVLPAASGCSTVFSDYYAYGTGGAWLYTFELQIDWCYNGYIVTSISPPQVHVYLNAPGWTYFGIQSQAQWDYYGDHWVYRTYVEGEFQLCIFLIGCIQTVFPYIYRDNYGDGGTWTEVGS
jgi:hypothetical protein